MKEAGWFSDSRWKRKISRKDFIKFSISFIAIATFLKGAAGSLFSQEFSFNGRKKKAIKTNHDLVVAEGSSPYAMTVSVIEAMGGMGCFVARGSVVVVKPNIGWDRTPEQAANTNPEVVAALIDLCFKAGAKQVKVFDVTCNEARRCYANSGIQEAAQAHGAQVFFANTWDTVNAPFPL